MTTDPDRLVESAQEQASAAWVGHLNQLRIDGLLRALEQQDRNLRDALGSLDAALTAIELEVVARNRGGLKGMHGFIAEVAEVGIGNARGQITGAGAVYAWVNDNGPVDMLRDGVEVQQKFVAAGGRLGLGAIAEHLERYPSFVAGGGRYQIPRDHFETIRRLHGMDFDEASRLLTRGGDGPSLRDWERVHAFFASGRISIDAVEPSALEYAEVQRGAYRSTLEAEREALASADADIRSDARLTSRATVADAAKATLGAAAIEGTTAFVLAVVERRRQGTRLKDFTSEDWADVAAASGLGFAKGGLRGLTIHALTNTTATSPAVAGSVVSAGLAIAEQASRLRSGAISEVEFIESAELVCLQAAVSALSSCVGQALIPVPVLGAVIGSTVGTVMYTAVSSSLSRREAELVARYVAEQRQLDDRLAGEHQDLVDELERVLRSYLDVLEHAFATDPSIALLGSMALARELGVPSGQVLDTDEKIAAFFLD